MLSKLLCCLSANVLLNVKGSVPADIVASWLSSNPFSEEPLAGYCAHAPQQEHTLTSPLNADEIEALKGATLVGLQVVVRHGARVPTSTAKPKTCFAVENFSMDFDCGVRSSVEFSTSNNAYGLRMDLEYPTATWDCPFGALNQEAASQLAALANGLRKHYDFGALGIDVDSTVFKGDDKPRILNTIYFLAAALYPAAKSIKAHATPSSTSAWSLTADCPQAKKEFSRTKKLSDIKIPPNSSRFAAKWFQVAGTVFKPVGFKDCLMQAACTPKPLPDGFTPELFRWAAREAVRANVAKFVDYAESYDALVAPAIFELQDALRLQTSGTAATKLYIYGSHDTAMIAIMVMLGIWDGVWPAYTETMVLEAYRAKTDTSKQFFRLLRKGVPVRVPRCGGTVCHIDVLLSSGPQHLRQADAWEKRCFGKSQPDVDKLWEKPFGAVGWTFALCNTLVSAAVGSLMTAACLGLKPLFKRKIRFRRDPLLVTESVCSL
eukprot:TRINITY_DN11568_c0_g2_i2.p1 TRINITY_DN11568_c0_g2~~TRINITY_DN11568_c0_g2_i2.p1  ORF type:complete len:491 (-),score=72.02 TRINITY_DN11568_c0_g2_i2:160-1632(-)